MRLKADDDDVTIFSFALQIFSASISHWGILIIQNLEKFMIQMVILRAQPFTSLMADLLQDDIGLLSQMKRVTKYKSSFMT